MERHYRNAFLHPYRIVDVLRCHLDSLVFAYHGLPLLFLCHWVLSRNDTLLKESCASIRISQPILNLVQEWVVATRTDSLLQATSLALPEGEKVRELGVLDKERFWVPRVGSRVLSLDTKVTTDRELLRHGNCFL